MFHEARDRLTREVRPDPIEPLVRSVLPRGLDALTRLRRGARQVGTSGPPFQAPRGSVRVISGG